MQQLGNNHWLLGSSQYLQTIDVRLTASSAFTCVPSLGLEARILVIPLRRAVEQDSRARDVRLQRALEEVDKYKQLLQDIKLQV